MHVMPIHLLHEWVPQDVQIMTGYGSHLLSTSRQTLKFCVELKNMTHERRILSNFMICVYIYIYIYMNLTPPQQVAYHVNVLRGTDMYRQCNAHEKNVICEYKTHLPLASR